jgi:hypothetical protein
MNNSTHCPKCSASMPPQDFVCDFCGTLIFDRIKNTGGLKSEMESFESGMEIIKENLNTLHNLPKPTKAQSIKSALRVLLALMTFGIVLIFWRRPKKRFNKQDFDKMASVISRDIEFLKISSRGSKDLESRINILESELRISEKQIKNELAFKSIAYAMVIVVFLLWIFGVSNSKPIAHPTYTITPTDSLPEGNISGNITIFPDSVTITHAPSGAFEEWQMLVKLKIAKLEPVNNKNILVKTRLVLTDDKGVPIIGLKPGEPEKSDALKLKSSLLEGNQKTEYYRFYISSEFNYTQYRDSLPENVKKFLLQADTIYLKE